MYPILFKFGKLTIYTYGLLIAIGFVSGILLAKREAGLLGQDQDKIMDLAFYILIAAIVGSRLFYVATNPDVFVSEPLEILKLWKGGLVFYGGFVAALLTGVLYVKKAKMSLYITADIFAPSLALGHFIGRIGCFFAGCCYGKVSELSWAVTFTHPESIAPTGVPLHPTQLYSALNNLIIFLFLWLFRHRKRFDGQLFWVYVFLYGITRSFLELFRGDFRGDHWFGMFSVSQVFGSTLAVTAVIMLVFLGKRKTPLQKTFNE